MQATNVISLKVKNLDSFFEYWFSFLKPFFTLTPREIEIAAALFAERFRLSLKIKDEDILNKVALDTDVRKKIMSKFNIKPVYLQHILSKMTKQSILIDGKANPRFIPNLVIDGDVSSFKLILYFDLTKMSHD